MPNERTIPASLHPVKCPRCDHYCRPTEATCPRCHASLAGSKPIGFPDELPARTITAPLDLTRQANFPPDARLVLVFWKAAHAPLTLALDGPLVLGREALTISGEEACDLSPFDALQSGVSRRHCLLRRHGQNLFITDLESANGTHLNGQLLVPRQGVILAHEDRLTLGMLRLLVHFDPAPVG
ncbi:MAG: FHA domain-containing protein [Chloroflexi bacterium]|nr:FHA domain-containing protein [Chloroflexota bacterium]